MATNALLDHKLNVPDEHTVAQPAEAVELLDRFLREQPDSTDTSIRLRTGGTDTTTEIPGEALRLLVDVLAQIANGNAVTVAPVHAELTTQQAADLLDVSRPYLVKLLEQSKIPHRRVGNRRRVMLADLITYKHIDDAERAALADQLGRFEPWHAESKYARSAWHHQIVLNARTLAFATPPPVDSIDPSYQLLLGIELRTPLRLPPTTSVRNLARFLCLSSRQSNQAPRIGSMARGTPLSSHLS